VSLKENPENNIDYLFLMDSAPGVSVQNIIQLCLETNLGAVLLFQGFCSDWWEQDEPFKLCLTTKRFVDSLRAAGLIVELHSFVHVATYGGYYAFR
jgi:hypothetical protein